MTIKMVEIFKRSRGRLFWKKPYLETRETILVPGDEVTFSRTSRDEDRRGSYEDLVWIKILDPNTLEYEMRERTHLPRLPCDINPSPEDVRRYSHRIFAKEEIRYVINKNWGGSATGTEGQNIDVLWEPNLPAQAKK